MNEMKALMVEQLLQNSVQKFGKTESELLIQSGFQIPDRLKNGRIEAEQKRQSQWCEVGHWIRHCGRNEVKNASFGYCDLGFHMNWRESPAAEPVGRTSTSRDTWGSSPRRRDRRGWTRRFRCRGMQRAARR